MILLNGKGLVMFKRFSIYVQYIQYCGDEMRNSNAMAAYIHRRRGKELERERYSVLKEIYRGECVYIGYRDREGGGCGKLKELCFS